MTTKDSTLVPLVITPGVQPSTDKTALATPHYTQADKIRFRFGFPQKIGGWIAILLAYSAVILGLARTLYSAVTIDSIVAVIGTNSKLYSLFGSIITNITPLQTTTTTIASAINTDFHALGTNPIATISGSNIITVTDSYGAANYIIGDTVSMTGATAVNGLTTGELNIEHVVHELTGTGYTCILGATATGTGSGGGSGINIATGFVVVNATAHGQQIGQRVKITGATATGGLSTGQINAEFIIRDIATNSFNIMTSGIATSSVTGGGGASIAYQVEITPGAINESLGQGYGMGMYGVGLYGTALLSSSALFQPRIWFIDRFGSNLVMTPGNQGGLYSWAGSDAVAPALVANAPTAINYSFVSNNILVTFGAGGIPNRVFSSDQTSMTTWTASSSNQVFDDTVVGAGTFKSHLPVAGTNLIFTDEQTYTMTYLGYTAGVANAIWNIQQLESNIGLIAPLARIAVRGTGFWMGQNNFYMWSGGNVQIIPANTQECSTILNYVFQNLNRGQASKCFAWYNELFDEIWFHYPSSGSNECDRVARLNVTDLTWVPDTFDRTCAESPNQVLGYPRLISSGGILYEHEQGVDANGGGMAWSITSNLQGRNMIKNSMRIMGDDNSMLTGFVPDSVQSGNINVEITGQRYPQSAVPMFDNTYMVSPSTEFVTTQAGARLWKYTISGSDLGQIWIGGMWHQYVKEGSKQ